MLYLTESGEIVNLEQIQMIGPGTDGIKAVFVSGETLPIPDADFEALQFVCLTKARILQDVERVKAAQAEASAKAAGILVPKLVPRGPGNNR